MASSATFDASEKLKAARACQRAIGRELRRMFDTVTSEAVPDEFLELLHRIDACSKDNIVRD